MKELTSIPHFQLYERMIMRVLFAWIVWQATPAALIVSGIPVPNGIARIIDLHFLLRSDVYAVARAILAASLIAYVVRVAVVIALPLALFINVSACAINNSQGAIQHAPQIVSLVLFAQTAAHYYGLWQRRRRESRQQLEDRTIWWSQQTIVAVYLVAGITKLIATRGMWPFQARWIGVSIAKSAWQSFYDTFDSAKLEQSLAVARFAASHGWIVAWLAAVGFVLELGSPLMLINRLWAVAIGAALIFFHVSLDYAMGLPFIFNQWLLFIFMINAPFWTVAAIRMVVRRKRIVAT